jgi:hypothetical protein
MTATDRRELVEMHSVFDPDTMALYGVSACGFRTAAGAERAADAIRAGVPGAKVALVRHAATAGDFDKLGHLRDRFESADAPLTPWGEGSPA